MTLLPLYAVVENPVPTTLLSQYVVGESPSITVNSMSYIPEAPNHITIWGSDDEYFITLEYTSVVGNTLSGLSRLYGTTAGTFPAGSHAVCAISKYDFDAIKSQFDSTNANLTAHETDLDNPHSVTKAQVGLPNVVDGAQINVIESISKNGTAQTIVNKNVNLVLSKSDVGLGNVDNTSDSTKATAEGNPIHDAIDSKEPKITKKTAFNKDFGNTAGTVCQGNDGRLSDARTPTAHAATHASNGTDAITIAESQVTNLTTDLGNKATKTELSAHTGNTVIHVTSADKTNWNKKTDKDNGSSVPFTIGCNANGVYFDY